MEIVDKAWKVQKKVEDRVKHIGKGRYGRVLKMARKPTPDEYLKTNQIVALGIFLIGGLGFLIYWIFEYGADLLVGLFR
ncbi:MAG TPA: protein translocase SEC61 complex subunit gamma [Euryarchaeota archaeon]|nr:protein translocase SEC61 complex subunit gamma [Euryarchaeota archaeon]